MPLETQNRTKVVGAGILVCCLQCYLVNFLLRSFVRNTDAHRNVYLSEFEGSGWPWLVSHR